MILDSVSKETEEFVVDATIAKLGSYLAISVNSLSIVAEVADHVNEPVYIVEAEFAKL